MPKCTCGRRKKWSRRAQRYRCSHEILGEAHHGPNSYGYVSNEEVSRRHIEFIKSGNTEITAPEVRRIIRQERGEPEREPGRYRS